DGTVVVDQAEKSQSDLTSVLYAAQTNTESDSSLKESPGTIEKGKEPVVALSANSDFLKPGNHSKAISESAAVQTIEQLSSESVKEEDDPLLAPTTVDLNKLLGSC